MKRAHDRTVFRHLERLNQLKGSNSVNQVRRALQLESPQKRESFLPFLNERDAVGKLIWEDAPRARKGSQVVSTVKPADRSEKQLLRKKAHGSTPSVGTYFKPLTWIKPTFSRKLSYVTSLRAVGPTSPTQSVAAHSPVRLYPERKEITLHRPRLVREKVKGIWEDIPLQGEPRQIKETLDFAKERSAINACLKDNNRVIASLKRALIRAP